MRQNIFIYTIELLVLFNLALSTSIAKCSRNDNRPVELDTSSGRLLGSCDFVRVNDSNPRISRSGNVYSFLGVPYAEPPINQNRFKAPEEVKRRSDFIQATSWPNSCVPLEDTSNVRSDLFQGYSMWKVPEDVSQFSEDCLYLNIWLPAEAYLKINVYSTENYNLEPSKLPIMVYFHGGGTRTGSTAMDIYNPATFVAATNTIVITVNYRLGVFGNFYLQDEFPGNQAILDQIAALRWVKNNAESLGGDPSKVTIYGHSAGGVYVGYHLLIKDSWDLFNNAILQSGTPLLRPMNAITKDEATRRTKELLSLVDCLDGKNSNSQMASCVQNAQHISKVAIEYFNKIMNSNQLTKLNIVSPFSPVIDGYLLKDSPEALLTRGEFKKCPIMTGYLIDEGAKYAALSLESQTEEEIRKRPTLSHNNLRKALQSFFTYYPTYPNISNPLLIDAILHEYTKITDPDTTPKSALLKPNYFHVLSKIIGDAFWVCPAYKFIDLIASHSPNNLYLYLFAHRVSSTPWPSWYGATHGDELAFTFAHTISARDKSTINGVNTWANPDHRYSSGEKLLTNEMIAYWSNFAKSDTPNSKNFIHWPEYTLFKDDFNSDNMSDVNESVRYIIFKSTGIKINRGYSLEICQFWNSFVDKLLSENENQVNTAKKDEPGASCEIAVAKQQIDSRGASSEKNLNSKMDGNSANNFEITHIFTTLISITFLFYILN